MRFGYYPLLLVSLAPLACVEQIYADSIAEFPPREDTTGSTTEPPKPTTTAPDPPDPDLQTVTGVSSEESGAAGTTTSGTMSSGTTTGPQANQPPEINSFDASAYFFDAAGPLTLTLDATDDEVVKIRLYLDDEEIESKLTLADFPYVHDILSSKFNGAQRKFKVAVEDAEGLVAEAETPPITITLPDSGVERCFFEDPDKGSVLSAITAIEYTSKGIFAVGTRGLKLAVWRLDSDNCALFPGWPKTINSWTGVEEFKGVTSIGSAVDENEDGNIVVGGNILVNGKPRAYVTLLTDDGARLWEHAGSPGDQLAGVAAGLYQHSNKVFVAGSIWTNDNPVRTDAAVWLYHYDGNSVFVAPPTTLRAPFTPDEADQDEVNLYSEWVRAVVVQPGTGYALAVGERQVKPSDINLIYSRMFVVRIQPTGGILGVPWTSTAEASFIHDAGRSVAACQDGFLVGGWTRDEPVDAEPSPMIFWFDKDMTLKQRRAELQMVSTEIHGIACDRENKVVSAATRQASPLDTRVFTVLSFLDVRVNYDNGVPGDDAAGAVACDLRGFCGWGGYRTANMMPYAVVRVHHP